VRVRATAVLKQKPDLDATLVLIGFQVVTSAAAALHLSWRGADWLFRLGAIP